MKKVKVETKVSQNYQTYVPAKVQKELGLKPNQKIRWIIEDGNITIGKTKSPKEIVKKTAGIGKDLYAKEGGAIEWLKKERQTWKR